MSTWRPPTGIHSYRTLTTERSSDGRPSISTQATTASTKAVAHAAVPIQPGQRIPEPASEEHQRRKPASGTAAGAR